MRWYGEFTLPEYSADAIIAWVLAAGRLVALEAQRKPTPPGSLRNPAAYAAQVSLCGAYCRHVCQLRPSVHRTLRRVVISCRTLHPARRSELLHSVGGGSLTLKLRNAAASTWRGVDTAGNAVTRAAQHPKSRLHITNALRRLFHSDQDCTTHA